MSAKVVAVVCGLVIAGVGFGVGIPLANANQPTGGECNNYGSGNVIVAPFCGATIVPSGAGTAPATTTAKPPTSTTLGSTLVTSVPFTSLNPIGPGRTTTTTPPFHIEQCPPYCGPGGGLTPGVPPAQ